MTAAERKRCQRRRERRGLGLYRLELPSDRLIEAFIRAGRVSEAAALDHEAVEHAASAVLVEWAARWLAVDE